MDLRSHRPNVLAGMRGDESMAALRRREGISESLYCSCSKEFLEAGKNRLVKKGMIWDGATTNEKSVTWQSLIAAMRGRL